MATSYLDARNLLAPYVDNGVAVTDTSRIDQRIDEAQRRLIDQYNFLTRREEMEQAALSWRRGGTTGDPVTGALILDNLDATKNMILALWREENNQLDLATGLETKAHSYIERNVMSEVERARRSAFQLLISNNPQSTLGGLAGRLGLETIVQYRLPDSRLRSFVNQAYQQAVDQYNFVSRREDKARAPIIFAALVDNAEAFNPLIPIEVVKLLALALIVSDNGSDGAGLKSQAFELIDRNVTALVEETRRNSVGEEGRLHNELPTGVTIPTARMTQYLAQAALDASAHYDFLARREDYAGGAKPAPFSFEIRKKLVESYIATASAAVEASTALKGEAFQIIERDLMQNVEAARRVVVGEEGRLHNELPEGVRVATSRLTQFLSQAATEAGAHWDFLARRENYSSGTKPNSFSYEVRKKYVESYLASTGGAVEIAAAVKAEAQALIERDLMAQVEAARRAASGEEGKLHNELPQGVTIPTGRLTTFLSQASTEIGAHQAFVQRREDYSGAVPSPTYEQRKMLVESYLATSAGQPEVAAALKQQAIAVVERDVMTEIENTRRATRTALLASTNDTFGYHWGRIGLELPEAYRLSDSAIQRMVNSAEEQLMLAGKWVGTVAEYTLSVSATGEFFLPREVETILFMSFDGDPKPVHDRLNEWLRGGTGYRETDDAWRQGAVDRGESIDPADNVLKRKYWITLPGTGSQPVVRILAKRRFVTHSVNSEKMYLRNYQAIFEATKGILLGGEQITPHIEKAKEMLASQIAQQSFTGNRGAAHTRRVIQFR